MSLLLRPLFPALLILTLFSGNALADSARIGTVFRVSSTGRAHVIRGERTADLTAGTAIDANDRIVTDHQALVQLILGQKDTGLLVKPDSDLVLEVRNGKDWTVSLKKGAVLTVVNNPEKRPVHFYLKTNVATMGVRGTTFFVRSQPGKPIFFCPCHGSIEVSSSDGKSAVQFVSRHHDNPKLISAGTQGLSKRMSAMPQGFDLDHSDGEIEDLKALLSH